MDEKYKHIGKLEDRVIEECSEVIHSICKSNRFGLGNHNPKTPKICNAQLILNEIDDLERLLLLYKAHLIALGNSKLFHNPLDVGRKSNG